MKIKEITYSNKYVTGPYLNHQPGFVAEIGENEDPIEALLKLKAIADEFDRRVNNFEERMVPEVQPERIDDQAAYIIDAEFAKAQDDLSKIEFQEEAIKYLNNNGWTFNIELKKIANSKPKSPTHE